MPDQRNLQWYRYVGDKGTNYAIMADKQWGDSAGSGLTTAQTTDIPFGPQTRLHHTRKVIYQDPVTFRTVKHPVGTVAAYGAAPSTINVSIVGSATPVTYNLSQSIPEKLRQPKATSHGLGDHP